MVHVPSCLLCGTNLPPDDKKSFICHLSVQHNVICSMEFVMMASHLVGGKEFNQVMDLMQNIVEKKENSQDINDFNCKEEHAPDTDNSVGVFKEDMHSYKREHTDDDLNVKKECTEIEVKSKKKRGIKKGSKILGCVDKRTLPKTLSLGPCVCPLCDKQFTVSDLESEKVYRRHLYVHRVKKFDCQCDKTWDTDKDLKLHIYNSHRGNFHCEVCRQTFQTKDQYEEHVESDPHKVEAFVCDDCGFTSSNKPTFYSHIKYHHDKNIKVCELCSKEFEGTFRLKLHMRSFHSEKKPCPLCGEMIKKLGIHMKTMHTQDKDKKYQCDQCGKGFPEMGKLEIHKMSVHINARPYECRYGCGAACNDKGNRKKHEVTKHGKSFEETEQGSLDLEWA